MSFITFRNVFKQNSVLIKSIDCLKHTVILLKNTVKMTLDQLIN